MIRLTKEQILLLHRMIAEATGGSIGIHDEGLLESAIESAYSTWDGKDLYPTKEEKAARIGFSLISNHAFVDGNKRIGIHAMLTFLELNGLYTTFTDNELINIGFSIAKGTMSYEDLLQEIRLHEKNM